eukprot:2469128-Rhodomonas_salina.4
MLVYGPTLCHVNWNGGPGSQVTNPSRGRNSYPVFLGIPKFLLILGVPLRAMTTAHFRGVTCQLCNDFPA